MKSVALAGQCFHRPAQFRHRNMYLISEDHLPLEAPLHKGCPSCRLGLDYLKTSIPKEMTRWRSPGQQM
ncbi:unnamed protein product [Rotaria socialis]